MFPNRYYFIYLHLPAVGARLFSLATRPLNSSLEKAIVDTEDSFVSEHPFPIPILPYVCCFPPVLPAEASFSKFGFFFR